MILVLLLLESELPRADYITLKPGDNLEALCWELCWRSLWCPPNHISLNFLIWGSCAWSMNQRVHILGMIMNWFQVVPEAFMAWSWLPLFLDQIGWRRKERQLAETFQLYVMSSQLCVTWEMMEISLARKGLTPARHVSSSNLIGQARTDDNRLQLSSCAETWLASLRELQLLGFVCELASSAEPCSWASLGLVIPSKWIVLPWVIYMAFINFVREIFFEGWVIIFPMS